jgi:HD-like signal output (HDOD) protein
MNKLKRILVLTDNRADSESTTPAFADLPFGWKAHFSSSPADALCVLSQVEFDLLFVDLNDGPLAGVQFLHEVWQRHPQVIRFLLGATYDSDVMLTCVMGGHQFLQKPLSVPSVRAALDRAELMDRMLQDKAVQGIVSRIRTFPSRPTIYVEVMKELRSPNASAITVGEIVSRDMAISTKLIQVINTAPFGLLQPVTTPADAVLMLGMEITASLVLGIEAFARLDNIKPLYFSIDQVWRHCQNVALTSKRIAELFSSDREVAHDAFTSGLLHDLGKVALAMNLEEQYKTTVTRAQQKKIRESEAEKELLGATHAEAGAYLLSLWGLPATIVEAVGMHHCPAGRLDRDFSATAAVHLANTLEYARHCLETNRPEFLMDLDYPEAFSLHEYGDALREIAGLPTKFNLTELLKKPEPKAQAETVLMGVSDPDQAAPPPAKNWFTKLRSTLLRA